MSIKLQHRQRQRDKQMFAVRYHTSHGEGGPKRSARCCDLGENHITLLANKKQQRQQLFFLLFRTDAGLSSQRCEKFLP